MSKLYNEVTDASILVLLATYNGARYLREQIDSILNQKDVTVSILIRDDGSTDDTWKIIESYTAQYPNIDAMRGENVGAKNNFFELICAAKLRYDYYAFSDQDDVWLETKLSRAIHMLQDQSDHDADLPCLYASKVIYANEDLSVQTPFVYTIERPPTIGNALLENICIGCTEVFNKKLLEIVQTHKTPTSAILHDWWMYLTATYFGNVVFDDAAYILYRQHGNNEVGMQATWLERWISRARRFSGLRHILSQQAKDVLEIYGCDEDRNTELVRLLAEYKQSWYKRLSLVTSKKIYRQNQMDDRIYRILFLVGYL